MADSLSSIGLAILSWGATYLIHSSLLVACVALFLRVCQRAGHPLRENLWKLALVGGVVTAPLQMLTTGGAFQCLTITLAQPDTPLGGTRRHDQLTTQAIMERAEQHDGAIAETLTGPMTVDLDTASLELPIADSGSLSEPAVELPLPLAPGRFGEQSGNVRLPPQTVATVGLGIVLVAMLLGLLRCLWQTLLLARRLAGSREISTGPAWQILDELRRTLPRTPTVRLLLVPDDFEPAAFGIGRWSIVIPQRAVRDLSHDELRALLAHELAHLVRGDSLWLGISRAVCSCLAFQPLNHLARREWQRAAEFLCDRWAVDRTGTPLALARCLAEVAGWRLAACRSNATLAATGRKTGLVDRIEVLLDARQPREPGATRHSLPLAVAGLLLAVLIWCAPVVRFATAGSAQAADGPTTVPAPELAKVSDNLAAVDFDELRVNELRDTSSAAGEPDLPAKSDVLALLANLDEGIVGLEQELAALEPLLRRQQDLPAARQLADRLQNDLLHLKQRRESLKTFWHR